MANPERNSFRRRAESTTEKVTGGVIGVLGVLSLDAPAAAIGLALYLIGRWRSPKTA